MWAERSAFLPQPERSLSALPLCLSSSTLRLPSSGCWFSGEQHRSHYPAEFSSTQVELQQLHPFHCSLPWAQVSLQMFSILFPTLCRELAPSGVTDVLSTTQLTCGGTGDFKPQPRAMSMSTQIYRWLVEKVSIQYLDGSERPKWFPDYTQGGAVVLLERVLALASESTWVNRESSLFVKIQSVLMSWCWPVS